MEMINVDDDVIANGNSHSCAYGCGHCSCLDLCYMKDACGSFCTIDIDPCLIVCVCGVAR